MEKMSPEIKQVVEFITTKLETVRTKLPARFVYKDSLGEPNPYDPKHKEFPQSVGVVLNATYVPVKGMVSSITFYEKVQIDEKGKRTYLLHDGNNYLEFTGNMRIDRDREELALYMFCLLDGSFQLNTNSKQIPYMYVDKALTAKTIRDSNLERMRIDKLVEIDITEDNLNTVAMSLGIQNVADLNEDELRNEIRLLVTGNKANEAKAREGLMDNPTTELRVMIQKALDKGIIVVAEVGVNKSYTYAKETKEFMKRGKTKPEIDVLTTFYEKDETEQEKLKSLVELGE
jgi:hypothetical protein